MRVGKKTSAPGKERSINKHRSRFYRLRADKIEAELKAKSGMLVTRAQLAKRLAAFCVDLKGSDSVEPGK